MHIPESLTWIDGTAEPSAPRGDTLHDPNTGRPLAHAGESSAEQVDRAIAAADRAHRSGEWRALGAEGRGEALLAFAERLDAYAEQIAELDAVNSGVPISVTRLFASSNGETARTAVALALARPDEVPLASADGQGPVRLRRIPWGPTALIMPWNAPSAMAAKKLSLALASGATAIMKPSPASPWSAQLVAQAAHEAGIPNGVVALVEGGGSVGAQLAADPRVRAIAMTGSTPTGRAIAAAAAPRFARLRLELGSSNPAIVRADADLGAAAEAIVAGALKLSGQWCEAPRRIIAPSRLVPELADAIAEQFASWSIGSSLDPATQLGPVAFEARRAELERQVGELGRAAAEVRRIGDIPSEGWFVRPTLIVEPDTAGTEEIFGPVLTLQSADDDEAALALAETGQRGLAGYVFGADEAAAVALGARLTAGEVKVNGTSVLDLSPDSAQSFFGDSGIGGHGDAGVLDFFVGTQIVGSDRPGLPL